MFNQKIPTLGNIFSLLILLFIVILILGAGVFLSIAILSAGIVPLTWIWGLISGQSYDRVCDNSEVLYRLNQIGKWTIVIGCSFLLVYLLVRFQFNIKL
jgi:hypothetical protein